MPPEEVRDQFGIQRTHGDWNNEWEMTKRHVHQGPPVATDHNQNQQPMLYGPKGEVLMARVPRPVGFRPPTRTA